MPTNKVTAAGIGGAITTILVYAATLLGVDVPGEVGAAAATLIGFGLGYLIPEPKSGTVKP